MLHKWDRFKSTTNKGLPTSENICSSPVREVACVNYSSQITSAHRHNLLRRLTWDGHFAVSVQILANNALRAHHASAHGGLSANGLSDICLSFFEMIILSCLKLCLTVEHSIINCSWEKNMSECVGRVSNVKKLTVLFA